MFAADATTFLADFGVAVAWAPSTGGPTVGGLMLFDMPGEVVDTDVISSQHLVTYETAAWVGLKRGEVLTIGGAAYKLRTDPKAQDDGVFSAVGLSKS